MHDYYRILNIPPNATLPEIKLAYHSLLLKHHPDKNISVINNSTTVKPSSDTASIDISLLKEAYTNLSSPLSRSIYDTSLRKSQQNTKLGPRPAQIISLEDFTPLPPSQEQKNPNAVLDEKDAEEEEEVWEYPCRCGGTYRISESDMDKGQHLVGCRSCSEVIWAGYEIVHEDDGGRGDLNGRG
jgi:diphthamide biosynthesis protein 4